MAALQPTPQESVRGRAMEEDAPMCWRRCIYESDDNNSAASKRRRLIDSPQQENDNRCECCAASSKQQAAKADFQKTDNTTLNERIESAKRGSSELVDSSAQLLSFLLLIFHVPLLSQRS